MKLSRDVKLKAGSTVFYFKYLAWDTDFFKKKSYILDMSMSRLAPSEEMKKMIRDNFKNSFLTIKIDDASGKYLLNFFQGAGFECIDSEFSLVRHKDHRLFLRIDKNVKIIEVKGNNRLPYKELGSNFDFSRFHLDKHIPRKKADSLWVEYIKNFKPDTLHRMFILKYKNETAGVALVNLNKRLKQAAIAVFAIRKKFQNRGLGSILISHVVSKFKGYKYTLETLSRNTNAIIFYSKNGFNIIGSTKTILHRWSEK